MKYITTIEDKQFLVEIIDEKHVSVDGKVYEVDFESVSGQPVYSLIVDGKSHEVVCLAGRRQLAGAVARTAVSGHSGG